ncbi:Dyp-type peroxidase [Flavobacterium sp. LS1R49]|uniref:Dyp-type peroxidase n=1 Tax=Flavobacterium shii TaxID=2987687 RepID=A0A9X3C6U0_9FLAO|nr:Dyp-type peroxidase [Flavobacterium shii]MCV9930192.1 Dyp-type peroxidase [Flavobacterium shii]
MSINSQNVLDYPNNNTIFMVWNFKQNVIFGDTFKNICSLITNLNNSAKTRFPESKASVVMGIGYEAWLLLDLPKPLPKELISFVPITGSKHTAVATGGDLHFHIRSTEYSFCIDAASAISNILSGIGESVEEIHGFRYWDSRSILGFVDGTENPHGYDRQHFGIIGDEEVIYKGGSYLFVQKYIHDLNAWKSLPVSEQEKIIGRSKVDDIEMSDDVKPSNSHSALSNVGDDLKIVRDNMPFGNMSTNEMGTYFIAYASLFSTTQKMLTKMFVGSPKGNYDRILDFSTPKTGALFFVPTFDMLSQFTE